LDHLQRERALARQDFGSARPRSDDFCKFRLRVAKFFNRVAQDIDGVEATPARQRPAPLLVSFYQRCQNVELVPLRRAGSRPPEFFDFPKRGTMMGTGANRADSRDVLVSERSPD
jgi:hypothetical protein